LSDDSVEAEDRQAIINLLNRFAEILDSRDWDRLGEVFTDESVAYRGGAVGIDDIGREIRLHLGGCGPSQHLLGNHQVELDGDTARSVTKVRVFHQGLGERSHLTFECMGDYHDDHVRLPVGWRIARRRFDVQMSFGDRSVLQPG
jgi:3-phenylpropionate/cinnamic acid dioxygenase small subunit